MKLSVDAIGAYRPLWRSQKRCIISIGGRGGARSYENSQKNVTSLKQTKRLFRAAIMRAVHASRAWYGSGRGARHPAKPLIFAYTRRKPRKNDYCPVCANGMPQPRR
jgi:hypothetical protein